MRTWSVLPLCLLLAAAAQAGEITVSLSDSRGRPVADAVIELTPRDASVARPAAAPPQTRVIDQKDEVFLPYVELFRPGDAVVFSNSDVTRHHVYSFSDAKRFEFVLASGERSPAQTLEAVGDIAVGCNIHDHMVTYLHVSEAPWMARSDADGRARIDGLPAGDYTLSVWHPQLKPGKEPAPVTVTVSDEAPTTSAFVLSLLPDPRGEGDLEQVDY